MISKKCEKREQVRWTDSRRLVHARHVERLVGMRHDISEPGGANETIGEAGPDDTSAL